MKHRQSRITLLPIAAALALSCASPPDEIVDGVSVNEIVLGETTWDELAGRIGRGCEEVTHGTYSRECRCAEEGLSIYTRMKETDTTVFAINVRPPFAAPTSRGIVAGKSSLRDVVDAYGPDECRWVGAGDLICLEYSGIDFCADRREFHEHEGETVVARVGIDLDRVKPEAWREGDPIERMFAVRAEGTLNRVLVTGDKPFQMMADIAFEHEGGTHYVQFAPGDTTMKGISFSDLRRPTSTFDARYFVKGSLMEDERLFVRYIERVEGTGTGEREVSIGVPSPGD